MTHWYIDTSAALKLVVQESESDALAGLLDQAHAELVSSMLLETELRRAAVRIEGLTQGHVTRLIATVSLFEAPASIFRAAGLLPGPHLRSLDALHLATAVRLGVDGVLTYDVRMSEATIDLGLPVIAPLGS